MRWLADVRNQTLRLLPEGPDKSHIMMLQHSHQPEANV